MPIAVISFQIQKNDAKGITNVNHEDTVLDMRFCHPACLKRVDICAVSVITNHSKSEG